MIKTIPMLIILLLFSSSSHSSLILHSLEINYENNLSFNTQFGNQLYSDGAYHVDLLNDSNVNSYTFSPFSSSSDPSIVSRGPQGQGHRVRSCLLPLQFG